MAKVAVKPIVLVYIGLYRLLSNDIPPNDSSLGSQLKSTDASVLPMPTPSRRTGLKLFESGEIAIPTSGSVGKDAESVGRGFDGNRGIQGRHMLEDWLIAYWNLALDETEKRELLKALVRMRRPELIEPLGDPAYSAADDDDMDLLRAVAEGLVLIGTEEAITQLGNLMTRLPQDGDEPHIVGDSLAQVRDTRLLPQLVRIVDERYRGYPGALFAMVAMGGTGVLQALELAESDSTGAVFQQLKTVLAHREYDDEVTETLRALGGYEKPITGSDGESR